MLGIAFTASRYEQLMNESLVQMAGISVAAATLQAKAVGDETLAAKNYEKAAQDETEARGMQKEAQDLLEASERDSAIANTDQVAVDELEAKAATEEVESDLHAAKAGVAAETADIESEQGAADGAAAARLEAAVVDDEIGVSLCQMIPFADVACDIVGGATAVVWEGMAADEAAKSIAEFAAAATATAQEDREAATAAKEQEMVVVDAGKAADLEAEAAAAKVRARDEATAAEQLVADAAGMDGKAKAEEGLAADETVEATAEEAEAARLLQQSVVLGVQACWDGIVVAVTGLIALTFFGIQMLYSLVIPSVQLAAKGIATAHHANGGLTAASILTRPVARRISQVMHHGVAFLLAVEIVGTLIAPVQLCTIWSARPW